MAVERTRWRSGVWLGPVAAVVVAGVLALGGVGNASRAEPAGGAQPLTAVGTAGVAGVEPIGAAATGRVGGADRVETAVEISRRAFPERAEVVYLARSDVFADALAAGSLDDGPVLLVPSCGQLPGVVRAEIDRLDPSQVVALGGDAAVCDEVLEQAAEGRAEDRLAGATRYETAVAIAEHAFADGALRVYVASGDDDAPDAVAGGVLTQGPVLLAPPQDAAPAAVTDAVAELDPDQVVGLGGPAALADAALESVAGDAPVSRLAGADRTETSREIARHQFGAATAVGAEADALYLARGDVFADAVAAGSLTDGPVVLVPTCGEPPEAVSAERRRLEPAEVVALGGPAAVCEELLETAGGPLEGGSVTDDAVVLDEAERGDLAAYDPDTGELVFDRPVDQLELEPGDVVASEPTDAAPNGLLVEVTEVTADGARTEVASQFAQVTDAIEDGHGSVRVELGPDDIAEVEALAADVEITDPRARPQALLAEPLVDEDLTVVLVGDEDNGVVLDGAAAIGLAIEAELDISWLTVDRFALVAEVEQASDLTLTAPAGWDWEEDYELAQLRLDPIVFTVAAVPVTVRPELTLLLTASGDIEATVETGVDSHISARAGVEYTDHGGFAPLSGHHREFTYRDPTLEGNSEAEAGLSPRIGARIYESAGAHIQATGYARGHAQFPGTPAWELFAGLRGSVMFDLEFPVLGDVGSYQHDIFEREWLLTHAPVDDEPPAEPPEVYGSTQGAPGTFFAPDTPAELYRVDRDPSGEDELVGLVRDADGTARYINDIALTADGSLYGTHVGPGATVVTELLTIDPDTAVSTPVSDASIPGNVNGLEQGPDGDLLGATQEGELLSIDPASGAATTIGSFGGNLLSSGDLELVDDTTLYLVAQEEGMANDLLAQVDLETGAATPIGTDLGFADVWGLFSLDGDLYGLTREAPDCPGGALLEIDAEAGAASFVRCLAFSASGATSGPPDG